ncbi:MAG: hypothetical protein COV75_06200 [Candidatus Omnitrophica bacterium CG11_big_fil_rev_8_21_14_0_20_63_9]|nr:MAG: hypothetical protein COV75_06200 [Candidatus Omnitrophica bacterium CG11_big_fil_rev_8_21_14_0_20_63_9]
MTHLNSVFFFHQARHVDAHGPLRYNALYTFMICRCQCIRWFPPAQIQMSLWAAALFAGLLTWGVAPAWAERPSPDAAAGRAAYDQYCARCHGASGKGDGVDAKRFYPRPRDLTMGVYKIRSTASGTPPTDQDLFDIITKGLPGSNMPDWQQLDEPTRWALVDYLKSLSPAFEQTQPVPIELPQDPGLRRVDLKKGKALYEQLACAACHGAAGRANGPSAAGLVDDWNMPIRPADLSQGWSYRGGNEAKAILTRLLAGIDGAGMPSYIDTITAMEHTTLEDAWHLAYYIASLQEPAHWNMIARARWISGALPSTPDDPAWTSVESTDVRVRNVVTAVGEWANPPTVRAIRFQVVANHEAMAIRLTWDDPTQDPQADAEASSPAPDAVALVLKPAGSQGDVVTLQAWPYAEAPKLDVSYWASDLERPREMVANDFETFVARPMADRNDVGALSSAAKYEDGRWTVVVQRPLAPVEPDGAAAIDPGAFTAVAFAIWDGGNPTARAVSSWVDLVLHQATHAAE